MFNKVKAKLISRRVPGFSTSILTPSEAAKKSHYALRDPVDSQGTAGQRILNQPDHRSGYRPGNWITPADGEIDRHQQGEIEDVELGDEAGDQGLQENRQQRDQHHHNQADSAEHPVHDALVMPTLP